MPPVAGAITYLSISMSIINAGRDAAINAALPHPKLPLAVAVTATPHQKTNFRNELLVYRINNKQQNLQCRRSQ